MSEEAGAGGGHHEALIIKRGGGGHHDEHHGGVWKIAFADFMTAMMAFFLVMWLISANDKTKAVIAKYFNPIELVDSTPQPRGLADPKKDDPNVQRKADAKAETEGGKENGKEAATANEAAGAAEAAHGAEGLHGKEEAEARKAAPAPSAAAPHPDAAEPLDDADHSPSHAEVELIRDPYAVLAEIADKRSVEPPKSGAEKPAASQNGGPGAVGTTAGEAFRDPFAPQPVSAGRDPFAVPASQKEAPPAEPRVAEAAASAQPPAGAGAVATAAPATVPPAAAVPASVPRAASGAPSAALVASGPDAAPEAAAKPLSPAALRSEIAAAAKALDPGPAHVATPAIEVRRTDEGVLISLTDTADYAMFASASARPSARTVALVGTIGKLLKNQKGALVVRGFTDNRPFRSDVYDNWRLSTERAHMAQYMLVRGGFDGTRIDRVEGYADRHPRNPQDPSGPENRRIEILLRSAS